MCCVAVWGGIFLNATLILISYRTTARAHKQTRDHRATRNDIVVACTLRCKGRGFWVPEAEQVSVSVSVWVNGCAIASTYLKSGVGYQLHRFTVLRAIWNLRPGSGVHPTANTYHIQIHVSRPRARRVSELGRSLTFLGPICIFERLRAGPAGGSDLICASWIAEQFSHEGPHSLTHSHATIRHQDIFPACHVSYGMGLTGSRAASVCRFVWQRCGAAHLEQLDVELHTCTGRRHVCARSAARPLASGCDAPI